MRTVTTDEALEVIASEPGVVLVDVTAEWCAPCKAIKPVLRQMGADTPGLTVVAVDADADPQIASTFDVMSFPTLLFFVERLNFIRRGKSLGFTLREISELLGLGEQRSVAEVRRLTEVRLELVERDIEDFGRRRDDLRRLLAACDGGADEDCVSLEPQ
jgi:thioredoxin 1